MDPPHSDDRPQRLTIGQLARRTGLPVRTIRFWSDSGVVPPAGRTASGYRLYDLDAVARLDLVRTLRELGLDLITVRKVLREQLTVAEVADAHLAALDASIRLLRTRRAVLTAVTRRGGGADEVRLLHKLAQLSAPQRQQLVDEFVGYVFRDVDSHPPGQAIAQQMRRLPAEPPDGATAEQLEAWVDLAALVRDPGFRDRVREMAVAAARGDGAEWPDLAPVLGPVEEAVAAGIAPESPEAGPVLERVLGPAGLGLGERQRRQLAATVARFSDPRVTRYWHLLGIVNGCRPPAATRAVDWFAAAMLAAGASYLPL